MWKCKFDSKTKEKAIIAKMVTDWISFWLLEEELLFVAELAVAFINGSRTAIEKV